MAVTLSRSAYLYNLAKLAAVWSEPSFTLAHALLAEEVYSYGWLSQRISAE